MKLGVFVILEKEIYEKFKTICNMGFTTCQLGIWDLGIADDTTIDQIKKAVENFNISITALWGGWPGPMVWDLLEGPQTLGLVPREYRFKRIEVLSEISLLAEELGVNDIVTHCGFIPEYPNDENYRSLIASLKYLIGLYKSRGQNFLFETGQETPVTLRRAIEDTGFKNVGVNLDPANLLMYGKANPIDALDILGMYVKGLHVKDGEYPAGGYKLGEEKPLGEGRVNFPEFIKKLKNIGYDGAITIEREITGKQQREDIMKAKNMLEKLIH